MNDLTIAYTIAMPEPWTHEYHVRLDITGWQGDTLDLAMPVWTPGSYLVREFGRHVSHFTATAADGTPLPWERLDKATWRVHSLGHAAISVRYRVYAFEWTVRTSHLTSEHGYFNGTNVFMYVVGQTHQPVSLRIQPYEGWHVSIALPRDEQGRYQACSYDELADSPAEIGTHRRRRFEVLGRPHEIALFGHGNEDPDRLVADMQRLVETVAAFFHNDIPYQQYLFIVHLGDGIRGGLEHRHSTTLAVDRWSFQDEERYTDVLRLVAHEYFHTWHVKRIRPYNFDPFDYSREVYTPLLWVMEGFTSYYDALFVRRAGLTSPEAYLNYLGERIATYLNIPGRHAMSVAESSLLAWVKLYRRDENTDNSTISYYLKGSLLALLLDLDMRVRTNGQRSLDDLEWTLWERYGRHDRGFTPDEFRALLAEVGGRTYDDFFTRYVEGTDELPLAETLRAIGLHLELGVKEGTPRAWLGIETRADAHGVRLASVRRDSPAAQHDLNAGDILLAWNGFHVRDSDFLRARLRESAPGDVAHLHLIRDGRLIERHVVLGNTPPDHATLTIADDATPEQRALLTAWLGKRS
nr:PDZ domain-containing protein [Ardenticatena sp.]